MFRMKTLIQGIMEKLAELDEKSAQIEKALFDEIGGNAWFVTAFIDKVNDNLLKKYFVADNDEAGFTSENLTADFIGATQPYSYPAFEIRSVDQFMNKWGDRIRFE